MDFDFNIILVPVTLLLGLIWFIDVFWLKTGSRQKKQTAQITAAQAKLKSKEEAFGSVLSQHKIEYSDLDNVTLADDMPVSVRQVQNDYRDAKRNAALAQATDDDEKAPFMVRMAHDFFPVLAVVLIVRSFIIEPFNIPSSSMVPSLYTGDFIAVNKYAYGIRLPLVYNKVLDTGSPEHGDVVVFRFPQNPKIYYIKRVIGLPGDTVSYNNGQLYLNHEPIPTQAVDFSVDVSLTDQLYTPVKGSDGVREWDISPEQAINRARLEERGAKYYQEQLGEHDYLRRYLADNMQFKEYSKFLDNVVTHDSTWEVDVPQGHYFVMGDNSDRSEDGRYWGFVPDENLAGKAVYVWMHKKPGLNFPTFGRNGKID